MCDACEPILVALEAVDANLSTLILARRTLTDRLAKLETTHTTVAAPAGIGPQCAHPEDRHIQMRDGLICDACGATRAHGEDNWVVDPDD